MGMIVEFNWFMVVSGEDKILEEQGHNFTVKSEKRVYPIGFLIPLIIKNHGCVGMIKVINVFIDTNETKVCFEIVEKFEKDSIVAKHYFDRYLDFKNREHELNP